MKPVDKDVIGVDVVDVVLDERPAVLVGHRVHRQPVRVLARALGQERHRCRAAVGPQQLGVLLKVISRVKVVPCVKE